LGKSMKSMLEGIMKWGMHLRAESLM
jgi:hypothetical protein